MAKCIVEVTGKEVLNSLLTSIRKKIKNLPEDEVYGFWDDLRNQSEDALYELDRKREIAARKGEDVMGNDVVLTYNPDRDKLEEEEPEEDEEEQDEDEEEEELDEDEDDEDSELDDEEDEESEV
jgi:hypothetical protein